MKLSLPLLAKSTSASRQFYVDELGLFVQHGEVWDSACRLHSVDSGDIELHLTTYATEPSKVPMFWLIVPDCNREFSRLRAKTFSSGGRLVPNKIGLVEMFEYPGGQNFEMEDPAGNRFVIHEDFKALEDE